MSELELKNAYRAGATDFATWLTTQETTVMVGSSRPVYAIFDALKEFSFSRADVFKFDASTLVEPKRYFLSSSCRRVEALPSSEGYMNVGVDRAAVFQVEFTKWDGTRRVAGIGKTLAEAWSEAAKAIEIAKQTEALPTADEIRNNAATLMAQIPDPQPSLGAFIIEPKGYHLSGAFHDLQFKRFEIKFTTIDEPHFTCYGKGNTFKAACNAAHISVAKHEAQIARDAQAIPKETAKLGLASNAEIIAELQARYEAGHHDATYRTVDEYPGNAADLK